MQRLALPLSAIAALALGAAAPVAAPRDPVTAAELEIKAAEARLAALRVKEERATGEAARFAAERQRAIAGLASTITPA